MLHLDPKTVARKLEFLGKQAESEHKRMLLSRWEQEKKDEKEEKKKSSPRGIDSVQFDEAMSFEHTKCKPLSIPLFVEASSRFILGIDVCLMPASGPLAELSRRKYGPRADHRQQSLSELLRGLKPFLSPEACFRSDSHPFYPPLLKRHFPHATHEQELSREPSTVGQGELKKIAWDPLFSINHTCAMLRAHVSRLIRRTWCTTKRRDRLLSHLWIYVVSHNRRILKEEAHLRAQARPAS
jgi:hypothetical protein